MKFEEALPYLRKGWSLRHKTAFYADECVYAHQGGYRQNRTERGNLNECNYDFHMSLDKMLDDGWEAWNCSPYVLHIMFEIKEVLTEFLFEPNTPETWVKIQKKVGSFLYEKYYGNQASVILPEQTLLDTDGFRLLVEIETEGTETEIEFIMQDGNITPKPKRLRR